MEIPITLNYDEWSTLTLLLERHMDILYDNMKTDDNADKEYDALLELEDRLYSAYNIEYQKEKAQKTMQKAFPDGDPITMNPDFLEI